MILSTFTHNPLGADVVEADLITAAQAGDEAAMMALISAYIFGLTNQVRRFRPIFDEAEDAEQEILTVFLEHIHSIDVTEDPTCGGYVRVVNTAYRRLKAERNGFGGIEDDSMAKYDRIMKRAMSELPDDATDTEILEFAEDFIGNTGRKKGSRLSWREFRDIHRAVNTKFAALEGVDLPNIEEETAEEYETIRQCVNRLPLDKQAIIRYAFGFDFPNELTDAEVVEEWSRDRLSPEVFERGTRITSRATVQRKRADALDTLRADFALTHHGIEE